MDLMNVVNLKQKKKHIVRILNELYVQYCLIINFSFERSKLIYYIDHLVISDGALYPLN